jgi:hypothetical protein
LQRLGSVTLVAQSGMVPGGQVPLARAALPPDPELLLAPGPVVPAPATPLVADDPGAVEGLDGDSEGAGALVTPEAPPRPEVPPPALPPDNCASAEADKTDSDTATKGRIRRILMARSHVRNDGG